MHARAQHAASEEHALMHGNDDTCLSVPSESASSHRRAAFVSAAVPAGGKTARMIASLAICVFSGLIFWVFKRRRARRKAKLSKKKKAAAASTTTQSRSSPRVSSGSSSPQPTSPQVAPASQSSPPSPAPPPATTSTASRTSPPPAKGPLIGSKAAAGDAPPGREAVQLQAGVDQGQQEASTSRASLAGRKGAQEQQEGGGGSSGAGSSTSGGGGGAAEGELRAALQKATRDLHRTKAALEESAKRGQAASAAAEKLTKQLQQATHEVAQLQAHLEQARAGHQQAEWEAADARQRESALGAEVQDLRTDVTKLRNQAAATSALQTTNATLTQRVKELEGQVEAVAVGRTREAQEAGRRLAEAQQSLEAALSARAAAEADRDKIKERSAEALRKVGSIQADMARISSQMEALRGERDELRGVVQGEVQARRNLEAALTSERSRCRALEVQHRAAQEAMRTMEARLRTLERRSGEFTAQLRQQGH